MSALAALELGDFAECARLATEGQAAARASTTPFVQGPALACLAYLAMHEGDLDRAGRLHEEVLDLVSPAGDKWGMGITLFDLALLRVVQQRHDEARALCAEGIALSQEFGDRRGIAWCLGILSEPRPPMGGRSARRGCAARWRVCSRAWAHPFKPASTTGLAIVLSTR